MAALHHIAALELELSLSEDVMTSILVVVVVVVVMQKSLYCILSQFGIVSFQVNCDACMLVD